MTERRDSGNLTDKRKDFIIREEREGMDGLERECRE